jgi:hypothetical protein
VSPGAPATPPTSTCDGREGPLLPCWWKGLSVRQINTHRPVLNAHLQCYDLDLRPSLPPAAGPVRHLCPRLFRPLSCVIIHPAVRQAYAHPLYLRSSL